MGAAAESEGNAELLALIDEVLGAFFELRLAGQRLGLVTESGGGAWGLLKTAARKPVGMAELARRRGVSRQYIQKIASGLIEQGYLELADNPAHRRSGLMTVTPAGRRALAQMDRRLDDALAPLGKQFSSRELRLATGTVAKLRSVIGRVAARVGREAETVPGETL
jgi:DNA-binding MarR family transcriptional regulator